MCVDLTGSTPALHENGSTAGLTHEWDVQTTYYTAKVPVWIDEITDAEAWKSEFLKPEAKEVVEAIGAWVYCFRKPEDSSIGGNVEAVLKAIQDVAEEHVGYGADVVMLAVAVPKGTGTVSSNDAKHADWEDLCLEYGFEYIDYAGRGRNEFWEKTGFERLKEALEANEWAMTAIEEDDLDFEDLDLGDDDDVHGFARDEAEMTAELFGMKAALAGSDFEPGAEEFEPPDRQENQVEDLDRLLGKLLAVKEQSQNLPEAQRKKMAAKAIKELMDDGQAL